MKKRISAFIVAALLCLSLFSLPADAVNTPCFVAVNDTLLNLEDRFIPITVIGQYYIPYTVLDSSATGIPLGINSIHNTAYSTLTIYNLEKSITFNLITGTCTDRNDTNYLAQAIIQNGQIYIPAQFTSSYFGLSCSTRNTAYGPLLRICSSSAQLDDNAFENNAQLQVQMESRLQEWLRYQHPEDLPAVSPASTPAPPRPTSNENENPDENVNVYLAFQVEETAGLDSLLEQLEQYQIHALFLFPAADMAVYDEEVRRVLCGGHAVGLWVSGATVETVSAQADEGNRLLSHIAYLRSNTVFAPNINSADARKELQTIGLFCLSPNIEILPDERSISSQANTVLTNLDKYRAEATLLSDVSAAGASLIKQLLPELIRENYSFRLAVEPEL